MDQIALNERTVTISMKRIDLCNLLLACTVMSRRAQQCGVRPKKWRELHDYIQNALEAFDKEQRKKVMNYVVLNERTVTISMKRIDLCDLMLACTTMSRLARNGGIRPKKWRELRDYIQNTLEAFDKEQGY